MILGLKENIPNLCEYHKLLYIQSSSFISISQINLIMQTVAGNRGSQNHVGNHNEYSSNRNIKSHNHERRDVNSPFFQNSMLLLS
jgi:hypothetical protein